MSNAVPQPRYSPEHKEQARRENLALFTLDIDRRFLNKEGGRVTSTGACAPRIYPYLRMLRLILDGIQPNIAAQEAGIVGAVLPDILCDSCDIGPAGHEFDCPNAQQ